MNQAPGANPGTTGNGNGTTKPSPTAPTAGKDAGTTTDGATVDATADAASKPPPATPDAGVPSKPPVITQLGTKAIPVCADDITGNPSLSGISVTNPGNSFTGGFKGDQDGAGGINLYLTSYPVVKVYRAEDVPAGKPAVRVIDDMMIGKAIQADMVNKNFSLALANLPPGSYLVALCAAEAKDRCEMTKTYQDAEAEANARGYDEPWQAFFNLNNKEAAGRFGFIGGSDRPIVVYETDAGTAVGYGGNLMVLWSKSDGKSWEYICTDDGHGGDANISPLVLDLGKGAALSSREDGVLFDLTDGQGARRISWPTSKDSYVLALDLNGNGNIDDGRELFGNYTMLGSIGYRAANGFEALAQYDTNHDLVIDARDPVFSSLLGWSDSVVRDGRVTAGELSHLADLRVRSIDVSYVAGHEQDAYGNITGQRGGIRLAGEPIRGQERLIESRSSQVVDIWFKWAD